MKMMLSKKVVVKTKNEGDSDHEANNKIVLTDTDEGLRDQFNHLFVEFTR